MKYKDYYAILGLERGASLADVKGAYRKLAHKYHPDVSKDPEVEAKFKEISEAYQTLKDPEKRAAYDQLGSHQAGQEFRPPPDWGAHFGNGGAGEASFDDIDLADLFAGLSGGRQHGGRTRADRPMAGRDYDVSAEISLEDAFHGTQVELRLSVPDYDNRGRVHHVERSFKARIPKGATDGQRLRLRGQGGKGRNGGPDGDLYLNVVLRPHPLFRVDGHDLYLDLPLAPWEAALGATIEIPTPGGPVQLKVPPGTGAGKKMRLAKRGLPMPQGGEGDLYAVVQLAMPGTVTEPERALYQQLAEGSTFDPRAHFKQEARHAG